ncbi:TPA: hypothetical protein PXI66_004820 [Escherichia coli]|nr:hypothetical protein [Escherichia coli]
MKNDGHYFCGAGGNRPDGSDEALTDEIPFGLDEDQSNMLTAFTFRRGEATIKPGNGIEQATHRMKLPEPPQEVN